MTHPCNLKKAEIKIKKNKLKKMRTNKQTKKNRYLKLFSSSSMQIT